MRGKIALATLAALTLSVGAPRAEPMKIRVAWVAPVTEWGSIWLEKKDLAKHLGQSYAMEAAHFAGTPPMITALANNQLEIAPLAYSTLGIAIENAGLNDLRLIADEFQDGVPGYYSQEFMVRKDGPIHKIEDLKGKVVATNAAGSAVDVALKAMLHKHGLEPNRDYTVIEAPFPAMKAMLAEKKVDLIPAVVPFSYNPELRQIARDLFVQRDAIGLADMIVWTAGTSIRTIITRSWPSLHARPSCRRRRSIGYSPRETAITIPTCCRTSMRCSATSTSRISSTSSRRAST